ncbi:MAG: hypothetical protein EP345_01585 [Sphingomonadales bacterium]|nr:MAG: hypothetical protein EP345_01585 [Sphingomonadales bacterium]
MIGFDEQVEKLFDLTFDLRQFRLECLLAGMTRGHLLIPQVTEQMSCELQQLRRRCEMLEQFLELAFE